MANFLFTQSSKLVDLLHACDPRREMYVRVLSESELALGVNPLQPTHLINLSKEMAGPYDPAQPETTFEHDSAPKVKASSSHQMAPKMTRRSGDYWFELNGQRSEHNSLKDLLGEGLRTLEQTRPGTLEKLSHIKPRSRRIVARDPKQLFERSHLAKDYAEKLIDGWWYGTNNSATETNSWLERACSCSGLQWGLDFKTSQNDATEISPDDL